MADQAPRIMNVQDANRRLVRANAEYARKIAVLRRGSQDALVLLRRSEAGVPRAFEALDHAHHDSVNPTHRIDPQNKGLTGRR